MHMDFLLIVSTSLGKAMLAELVCKTCTLRIGDRELTIDLILLDLDDFDIILGIKVLASYHAIVNCYTKEVLFQMLSQVEFSF